MKIIQLNEYNKNNGILIDVQHPIDFINNHHKDAINIYYEKLMYNPTKYLNKNKHYFITCNKGVLSTKVVRHLEFLGYNVIKVIK